MYASPGILGVSMLRAIVLFACLLFSTTASADDVLLKTSDGVKVHADYNAGKNTTGVVLVHMLGRSGKDWRFFSDKLNANGMHTIAVDLRHHGANLPEGGDTTVPDEAYGKMRHDVEAAVAYLRTKGCTEISIVGASIGANLALVVAADDPGISNVVLLSPGLDYKGVSLEGPIVAYGERPLLIVVSKEDQYSAKSGLLLDSEARGYHVLEIYEGAGHGTKMLNREPSLESMLISWLNGSYRLDSDGMGSGAGIQAGDASDIQTEGKKLGEE